MEKLLYLALAIGLFGLLASTVYTAMAIIAALQFRRLIGARKSGPFFPPVSMLKPLHGAEPGLESYLATFFQQDYPDYEILFCARHSNDAGLEIARRVATRYPHVPVKFLASGEPTIPNAKILSLECMLQRAQHQILIVSDSDVRVDCGYLREVVQPFADSRVGAVTCLYRGVASEGGLWSRLEGAAMSIEMSAGVLVANSLEGMKFALGPTMAVRRSCLNEIGGFLPMGRYCADDFLLGNWVAARGHSVVLSTYVIDHMVLHSSFWPSMQHQARWMKSTRFSRPKGHFGSVLTFSVPFGILTALAACALVAWQGTAWFRVAGFALAWSVLSRVALAWVVSRPVLREKSSWQSVLLYPLRDLLGIFFWAASYGSRKILWRNETYILEKEGRMRKADSRLPSRPSNKPE
jgi:ceramide glucosyltransferase